MTNFRISNAAATGAADSYAARLNNGYLRLYSGTQPAGGPDAALSGNTLLAELRFNATAAPTAVNGVSTYNAITQDAAADAGGVASFFRAFQSDGTTAVCDGDVGTAAATCIIANTTIVQNAVVTCSSFVVTQGKG